MGGVYLGLASTTPWSFCKPYAGEYLKVSAVFLETGDAQETHPPPLL